MSSSPITHHPVVVDIHTHIYPPSYISLLSSRTTVPYIYQPPSPPPSTTTTTTTTSSSPSTSPTSPPPSPRLIILPSDDDVSKPLSQRGRPIDTSYSSWSEKRRFMRQHNITVSVVSLANPWLDFLDPEECDDVGAVARTINDDLERACAEFNSPGSEQEVEGGGGEEKLFFFGTLPLSAREPGVIVREIERLKGLRWAKGVVMGTTGLVGSGLDSPLLSPIYAALQRTETLTFLHPHYGLPASAFGGASVLSRSGHVLPLALGFPLETTIAVSRMFVAGVFDRFPQLKLLLAHSGGALPFLAGRLESCVLHEREFLRAGDEHAKVEEEEGEEGKEGSGSGSGSEKARKKKRGGPQRSIWSVLNQNLYLDAVIYGEPGLKAAVAAAAAAGGSGNDEAGINRVMFGTDHPFFPPIDDDDDEDENERDVEQQQQPPPPPPAAHPKKQDKKWESVQTNYRAIRGAFGAKKNPPAAAAAAAGGGDDEDDGSSSYSEAERKILGGNAVRVLGLEL